MYELIQLAENTFFMECPSRVGIFRISSDEVVFIDSGSDKDSAKKLKKILDENNWKLKAIYNTHSHADHIGGNKYLQSQTGCRIYSPDVEQCFTEFPILEPTFLYGGSVPKELSNKFLMAGESPAQVLTEDTLPQGLSLIRLNGHSFNMVGFRTSDDVVFLADSLVAEHTLNKYGISYVFDVGNYLETLESVKGMKAKVFAPSHVQPLNEIENLAQLNIDKTLEVKNRILSLLSVPKTFEELLSDLFNCYSLSMNFQQYVLVGSTVKSYLSYLNAEGSVGYSFENNRMTWFST